MGVQASAQLDLHDAATLTKLTRAMIRVENGPGASRITDQQIAAGLAAATGGAALPAAPVAASATRDSSALTGIRSIDSLPDDWKLHVLQLARSQAHQGMAEARESLRSKVQDASAEYMARGAASNPPDVAEFVQAYGQADGMRRYQDFQGVASLGQTLQQVKVLPAASLAGLLESSKPAPGEGFAARQHNYEILTNAVEHVQKARKDDPVAVALTNPAYGIKPITTFSNPDAIANDLGARGRAMGQIASDFNTPPAVMTKAEARAFEGYMSSLQAIDKARVLGQVAEAVGPAGMQAISVQLKDKNSTLAIAGALSSKTTTLGNSAATLYLEGKEMLSEKRAKIDTEAETGIKASIYKAIDGVYASPQGRDAAADAAFGIYAKLKSGGEDDIERALRLATGGILNFNGNKIAKPYGWTDGAFTDALKQPGLIPERFKYQAGGHELSAKEVTAMLPGAKLQTYGDGTYLIKSGNDVVRRNDGSPFILKVGP